MTNNIKISAEKSCIKKGDSVNVSWSSILPDSLILVIDDGDTVQRIQVPDSGSRICWSNNARTDMNFTIVAVCNGRKETDSVKVKVKKKNEKTSPNQGGIGKFQMWREKMRARFSVARAQRRYQWASLKKWQKILWIAILLLPFILLLISGGSK